MTLQPDGQMPYAPAKVITGLMDKHRFQTLRSPVDAALLKRHGVTDSLIPRTLASLRLLGLIDTSGTTTSAFETLRRASEEQYQEEVAGLLHQVYASVFEVLDMNNPTPTALANAFRLAEPAGQRPRMISLFTGLCEYAGLMSPQVRKSRVPSSSTPKSPSPATKTSRKVTPVVAPKVPAQTDQNPGGGGGGKPDEVSVDAMRRLYFDALIEKFKASDGTDGELLDRIDRLVGLVPSGGPTSQKGDGKTARVHTADSNPSQQGEGG